MQGVRAFGSRSQSTFFQSPHPEGQFSISTEDLNTDNSRSIGMGKVNKDIELPANAQVFELGMVVLLNPYVVDMKRLWGYQS